MSGASPVMGISSNPIKGFSILLREVPQIQTQCCFFVKIISGKGHLNRVSLKEDKNEMIEISKKQVNTNNWPASMMNLFTWYK